MSAPDQADEFARLSERLHAEGWASHVSVEPLMRGWQKLATDVADYPFTIDDYTNDLTGRDALQLVLGWASPETASTVGSVISGADDQFRASTSDDGGLAISRYFRTDARAGWWWKRRPTTGRLARYLDSVD